MIRRTLSARGKSLTTALRKTALRKTMKAVLAQTALAWVAMALLVGPAMADPEDLEVLLIMPTYGEPIFGEVEIGAEIYPPDAEIDRVEFYLDSRLVGLVEKAPYTQLIDVGEENIEHDFRVVVYDALGRSAESGVKTPRIETDEEISVDLQQLFVAVERDGERVLDLEREDFAAFDNGVRQDLITFERGDVPFTAIVLVDASSSMRGRRLEIALEGAEAFVEGMRELDQAKLLLFSDKVVHETPFTTFASVINLGLTTVDAGGGTALNDHLYLAMKRLEERQGRRVIIVLSDGIDVESVLNMEQVRWKSSQLQPVIYWIRLNENDEDKKTLLSRWRKPEEHTVETQFLHRSVTESGGRIEEIRSIDEVAESFQWILEDLRNQYVLGYYPPKGSSRDPWHEVTVRVRERGLEVRSRSGYLKPQRWSEGR